MLPPGAQCIAHIARDSIEPADCPGVSRRLGSKRCIAKLSARALSGQLRAQALLKVVSLEHSAMELELFSKLTLEAIASKRKPQFVAQPGPHHDASITAKIAPATRAKASASSARRFRPARVIRYTRARRPSSDSLHSASTQ